MALQYANLVYQALFLLCDIYIQVLFGRWSCAQETHLGREALTPGHRGLYCSSSLNKASFFICKTETHSGIFFFSQNTVPLPNALPQLSSKSHVYISKKGCLITLGEKCKGAPQIVYKSQLQELLYKQTVKAEKAPRTTLYHHLGGFPH